MTKVVATIVPENPLLFFATHKRSFAVLALVAAITACDLKESESGSEVTPPSVQPPSGFGKSWHTGDLRISFDVAAGSYQVDNFIGGVYQLTEGGSFNLRGSAGELHGTPVVDLMGGLGWADNGAPFSINIINVEATTLTFIDRMGATISTSAFPPALENAPIEDRFEDGVIDPRWWTAGNVFESSGVLHVSDSSSMAGLWQLGFTDLEAYISLTSASSHANVAIGYRPWDENVTAKCGVSVDSAGDVAVFAQVYDEASGVTMFHSILAETVMGATHQCRMVWSGGKVDFYVDQILTDTFIPAAPGNYSYCGEPCVFAWSSGGDVQGTVDDFRVLN